MIKPAVVIAGYNRPDCIKRLMRCVCDAYYPVDNVTLIVSLDFSEKTEEIIKTVKEIGWDHGKLIIRCFDERQGLKKHILSCGDLSEEYEAVIVLEDDLYVSPNYYSYAYQLVNFYRDDNRICGVSLYCHGWNGYGDYQFLPQKNEYDTFIGQIGVSWGQCWTRSQWLDFREWYKKNKGVDYFNNDLPRVINEWGDQSWAKYFYNYMVEKNKYYVIPYISLSTNFSEPGEHNYETSTTYQVMILDGLKKQYNIPSFEKAIKYDMYFERMLGEDDNIGGIKGTDICFNLYGFRDDAQGKKYVLTTKRYEGVKEEKSFGLRMRPIEQNVINGIPGADIYLYKTDSLNGKGLSCYRRTPMPRIRYELYGNPLKRLSSYCNTITHANEVLFDLIEIDKKAWGVNSGFELVQEILELKIREQPDSGQTWMFHEVSDTDNDSCNPTYSIDTVLFEKLLAESLNNGYTFKGIDEIERNPGDNCVFVTFDDGYKGVYENAYPICKKHGIPFCIFVTVDFLNRDGYLTDAELKEMGCDSLCTIGAHTISHPKLRFLSDDQINYEIRGGKQRLEEILDGRNVEYFAYPYGSVYSVDQRCIESAMKTGYKCAFSTLQSHNTNMVEARFFLPRINMNSSKALSVLEHRYGITSGKEKEL